MRFEASAPTRIDLAGGTLDIWPLYVLEGYGLTVNAAIGLRAGATLTKRDDKKVSIASKDTGARASAANISGLGTDKLELYSSIAKYFNPDFGFDVELRSSVPAGSGLGASSSLAIALAGLLNKLTGKGLGTEKLIWLVGNLEAKAIMLNTGKQDYYAAYHGGFNSIWFKPDGDDVERHDLSKGFLKELSGRTVLCFTGQSHFSATNNWEMLKRYIDDVQGTRKAMAQIKEVAHKTRDALRNEDMDALVSAIDMEWENRKRLADGVTNERIDGLIAAAREKGALAAKICGAGGGGCMVLVCKDGAKEGVESALAAHGAKPLAFDFDGKGLRISNL